MGDARGRVLVLGAGVMGHGIAQVAAMAGHPTVLTDPDEAALARAMARVRANLDKGVDRGKVTSALRDDTLGRLEARSDATAAAGGAAYVIEAVPEVMALKQQIFRELDDVVPRDCVFGTNTSSLPITEIASETRHPDRVTIPHSAISSRRGAELRFGGILLEAGNLIEKQGNMVHLQRLRDELKSSGLGP